jgi:hypothetical protein
MKPLLALLLVLALLLMCAIGSVLLARGWFTLRAAQTIPPAPVEAFPPPAPTPTLAALPPAAGTTPIGGALPAATGFNGAFSGTLSGDNGSSAPATLTLTQSGADVAGRLSIGDGLTLDAGNCGLQAVPAGDQNAAGTIDPANPNRLTAAGSIPVSGFTIGVALAAELAADGQTLTARADLDLPLLCGSDPAIRGVFARQ